MHHWKVPGVEESSGEFLRTAETQNFMKFHRIPWSFHFASGKNGVFTTDFRLVYWHSGSVVARSSSGTTGSSFRCLDFLKNQEKNT